MTSPDTLCMGCMAPKDSAVICPDCGWREGTLPDSTVQLPPRTLLDHIYILGRVLGQGGFGVTYLAWDMKEEQKQAVKEYLPGAFATRSRDGRTVTPSGSQNWEPFTYGLKKFTDEAAVLKRFAGHPNIVGVHDFLRANGTAYIVMDYVEGITLKQYLEDKGGKIPFETALKILTPIMDALREVHKANILHRDISPDNIYLCYSGPVKLLDFGATKQAIGEHSKSIQSIFKAGYTPQEQYLSEAKQGPWTDVYALGATFYRSITGQIPPNAWERLEHDDLSPPSHLGVTIPQSSESALMQALAVRPELRWRSVSEFQVALAPKATISEPELPQLESRPSSPASVRLSKAFYVSSSALGVGVFGVIAIAAQIQHWAGNPTLSPGWTAVGYVGLIFSVAVIFVLIYKMWAAVQDESTGRSPVQAMVLAFVPVYGMFQALWAYSKEYNAFLLRHSLQVPRLPERLLLVYAILSVTPWVLVLGLPLSPVLGVPSFVAYYFVGCMVVYQICDAVNALPETLLIKSGLEKLYLYCTSGEFEGNAVEVSTEGIIIGRSLRANLILSSVLISGKHARVWPDPAGSSLWVEDLHSTNGTSYLQPRDSKAHREWIPLQERTLLMKGGKIRLGGDVAEFELRGDLFSLD